MSTIARLSGHAEESAFVLLALQAPVAGDLRSIVSAIQMVADIDRMGALALHVAKITRRRHPQHALPEEVNGYFAEMGRVAVELGNSAQEVVLSRDPEKAARIREEDDAMDDLQKAMTAEGMPAVMADVANYTTIQPVMQTSEVVE